MTCARSAGSRIASPCCMMASSSGRVRSVRSTAPTTPICTSSSMACPKARSQPSDRVRPAWPVCLANLLLLGLYPLAWQAPLARAGLLPWFGGSEISVLSGIRDLWVADMGLAALVGLLAVVIPYGKTLLLSVVHLCWRGPRSLALPESVWRLSIVAY